jgi:valyl-tRNA synthetase
VAPPVPLRLRTDLPHIHSLLERERSAIEFLVRTKGPVAIDGSTAAAREPGTVLTIAGVQVGATGGTVEVLVGLKGLVDAAKERLRVEREMKRVERDLAVMDKKLGSAAFVERAPADVVAESKAQRAALAEARDRLVQAKGFADEL